MSVDQEKFLRWLVSKYLHLYASVDESAQEFWHAHEKALRKQGVSREDVVEFIKLHARGA